MYFEYLRKLRLGRKDVSAVTSNWKEIIKIQFCDINTNKYIYAFERNHV